MAAVISLSFQRLIQNIFGMPPSRVSRLKVCDLHDRSMLLRYAIGTGGTPRAGQAARWSLNAFGWTGAALIIIAIFIVVTKQTDQASIEAEAVTPAH